MGRGFCASARAKVQLHARTNSRSRMNASVVSSNRSPRATSAERQALTMSTARFRHRVDHAALRTRRHGARHHRCSIYRCGYTRGAMRLTRSSHTIPVNLHSWIHRSALQGAWYVMNSLRSKRWFPVTLIVLLANVLGCGTKVDKPSGAKSGQTTEAAANTDKPKGE